MEVKESKTSKVIFTELKSTLKTITQDVGNKPEMIYSEVEKNGLEVSGPMVFVYRGVDGNIDAEFDLEICLPIVEKTDYKGNLKIKDLEGIKHVSHIYNGEISKIGSHGHAPFMNKIMAEKVQVTDQCREVYLKWDNPQSKENVTEIQMQVA